MKGVTTKMLTEGIKGTTAKRALLASVAKAVDVPARSSVRILRLGGINSDDSDAGVVITVAVLLPNKRGASRCVSST